MIRKVSAIASLLAIGLLAACGPGDGGEGGRSPAHAAAPPVSTAPQHDGQGVIAAIDGQVITIDHDGSPAAPLPAGRTVFQAYADVLAESPLQPGARVAFKFRKDAVGQGWELTEVTAR